MATHLRSPGAVGVDVQVLGRLVGVGKEESVGVGFVQGAYHRVSVHVCTSRENGIRTSPSTSNPNVCAFEFCLIRSSRRVFAALD